MNDAQPQAVVIGASAGAIEALSVLLSALPATFALPVVVVVHIPPNAASCLADVFRPKCALRMQEAEDKAPLEPGTVFFAPPDYHLLIEATRSLALNADEPVLYSRPSIDVLFESAADAYGPALIGIILSGANEDGAAGLRTVAEAGGTTIIQDPKGAFASAMPEAAMAACPSAHVLPLAKIAAYLQEV
jgi:two-component system chemotaxis response regulator CheB